MKINIIGMGTSVTLSPARAYEVYKQNGQNLNTYFKNL